MDEEVEELHNMMKKGKGERKRTGEIRRVAREQSKYKLEENYKWTVLYEFYSEWMMVLLVYISNQV